jgi:ABC-type Mn2+/Zn2+ transport system ATPase subunit
VARRPPWTLSTRPLADHAVTVEDLTAGYGGTPVLRNLSFAVTRGEFVGAVGPSGSGKTTLLRVLTGRAEMYGGSATVFGQPLRGGRSPRNIGYVPQLSTLQPDFPIRVREAVLLGLTDGSGHVPWFSRRERALAEALIERLGLGGLGRQPVGELSGGQLQRVLLASAMVRGGDMILLDEPTSGVDLQTRHEILGLLAELNRDGTTVILTTHDLNWVAAHLPRVLFLNGALIADGSPEDVFTAEVITATYGGRMRVLRDEGLILVADDAPVFDRLPHAEGSAQ